MSHPGHRMLRVAAHGADLHVEVTAAPRSSRRPVLLISGADSPASRWRPDLVSGLVAAGHDVVRYDHRDVGRSSPATDAYDLHHLTADAVAVIDALDLDTVHVVGSSMGGMIGQLLALDHRDRVSSLTAAVSSPDPVGGALSAPSPGYLDAAAELIFAPQPVDDAERVERILTGARLLAGSRHGFDEAFLRADAATGVAGGWILESGHLDAVLATPSWYPRLGEITCAVLVVNGTEDPLFGTDHADAFVAAVPHARVEIVEGLGHEFPDGLVAELLPTLLAHLGSADGSRPGGRDLSSSGR